MRTLSALVLSAFVFTMAAFAQAGKAGPEKRPARLSVDVENGKSVELFAADLAKLPRKEVRAKDHDGKEAVYSGTELRDVLLLAGARFGKDFRGTELSTFVVIEAADGYHAVFGSAELDTGFTDKLILLADTRDGKPLPDTVAPWQIIVPDDKKHGRWVRQVTAVRLRSAVSAGSSKPAAALSDADAARAELIRQALAAWPGDLGAEPLVKYNHAVYLSIDNRQDPSDELLAVFKNMPIPFRKRSGSVENANSRIVDKVTQEKGLMIFIGPLEWITKDRVKAEAGYFAGALSGGHCEFTLIRVKGFWKLDSTGACAYA